MSKAKRPKAEQPIGLILFHGAGGDRDHHTFLRLEAELPGRLDDAFAGVARINFPYRQKGPGRRPPDRMPKLVDAVNEAVEQAEDEWGIGRKRIVLGGRSMGGRAASMAVAEGLETAGLVWLSYPLHPTGKPEKLRVDHFPQLSCPILLIQGTRDPFGKPDEFAEHLPNVAGPLHEHWLDANHSPAEKHDELIVATVADWLAQLL